MLPSVPAVLRMVGTGMAAAQGAQPRAVPNGAKWPCSSKGSQPCSCAQALRDPHSSCPAAPPIRASRAAPRSPQHCSPRMRMQSRAFSSLPQHAVKFSNPGCTLLGRPGVVQQPPALGSRFPLTAQRQFDGTVLPVPQQQPPAHLPKLSEGQRPLHPSQNITLSIWVPSAAVCSHPLPPALNSDVLKHTHQRAGAAPGEPRFTLFPSISPELGFVQPTARHVEESPELGGLQPLLAQSPPKQPQQRGEEQTQKLSSHLQTRSDIFSPPLRSQQFSQLPAMSRGTQTPEEPGGFLAAPNPAQPSNPTSPRLLPA